MIETDKLAEVEALVKENPRYLIASGDTPTILQVCKSVYQAIVTFFINYFFL